MGKKIKLNKSLMECLCSLGSHQKGMLFDALINWGVDECSEIEDTMACMAFKFITCESSGFISIEEE